MPRINLSGITLKEFFVQTKKALEATLGSPIKKDRVVRQFLTHQLHGGTGPGENEHNIAQFFGNQKDFEQEIAQPRKCTAIKVTKYSFDLEVEKDERAIEDVECYLCMTDEAINRKLEDIFQENFPDHDGVAEFILDAHLIGRYLEKHDDENDTLCEKIAYMPSYELRDWLMENFPIRTLVFDPSLKNVLWEENDIEISTEVIEILY